MRGAWKRRVALWEKHGLCWSCGHSIEAHGEHGCDYEVRDYGEMDCGCTEYTSSPDKGKVS